MSDPATRQSWERWIADSYSALLGRELTPGGELYSAPMAVLCHRVSDDPLFVYGNEFSQRLWERPWSSFVGMPSRLTAPPEHRGPRSQMLAANQVATGYSGERISATGRRFQIHDATVWPVTDDAGVVVGQAAAFHRYQRLDQPLLEVLATSAAQVAEAVERGADRVELCADYDLGGTTPDLRLVRRTVDLTRRRSIGVMVMIRPRGGDFVYSRSEVDGMKRSIEAAIDAGASGLVFGCLTRDGRLDRTLTAELMSVAPGVPVTFHRAVDASVDPVAAALAAFDLGCLRVLTSGAADTAPRGSATIRRIVELAPSGAVVLAGGGVRADNAEQVRAAAGVTEVHASMSYFAPTP